MNVDQFRAVFPAFASKSAYPDDRVGVFLDMAQETLDPDRFSPATLSYMRGLFAAHSMALSDRAGRTGVVNSKSVDGVSVGYDNQISADPNAGHWNLTTYGQQYYRQMQIHGAGPVQIGGGSVPPGVVTRFGF